HRVPLQPPQNDVDLAPERPACPARGSADGRKGIGGQKGRGRQKGVRGESVQGGKALREAIPVVRQLVIDPVLSPADARELRAGDRVVITGQLLTARDAACQRMVDALAAGGRLPFDLAGRVIYAVGPTPARP